jgi:pyrroline-5-carboxylate reductase
MHKTIAFIGGGNMARSLIGGLLARGWRAQQIVVADPMPAQLESLRTQLAVRVTDDNATAAREADIVVLSVKPQEMQRAAIGIRQALAARRPLLISVAAGIRASDIQRWLPGVPIVRSMPNRPALQGCGMTGLYAAPDVSAELRAEAEEILGAVGATLWLEREQHMDVVTAVSASGPAYFFLLIEMLEHAGTAQGLSPEVSRRLAIETAYGSGAMARAARESPAVLREQVTSKGGTTEAAVKVLEEGRIREAFDAAVAAATRRAAQLADEFGSADNRQ